MSWVSIWLRGLAMGAADAVPGVSGGTVAFLTGIYERWLAVLTAVTPELWSVFRNDGLRGLWVRLDGAFVLPLLIGILMSLLTLAHWIKDWLDLVPERVWGFFFGLVIAMGIALLSDLRSAMRTKDWGLLIFGVLIALSIGLQTPQTADPGLWVWPLAGAMALSAMLLPGISGSFLLLLTGLYPALIGAVSAFDLRVLLLFIGGGAIGILLMAHLIKALLIRYQTEVLSCLTGVVFGALVRVWPWQGAGDDGSLILLLPTQELLWIPLAFGLSGFAFASLALKFSTDHGTAIR
jgi:putative membrane protein